MKHLPSNWALARVGDLIDLGPKNECAENTEVGFVPLQRLGVNYRSRHTFERKPWSTVKRGYTHFADGDVLLARITPSFENGKAGIVRDLPNGLGAGSTEYFVCRPLPGAVLPEYLLAHFKVPLFLQKGEQVMSGAVGQQRVPKQYLLGSIIPLAPFNEQKRIAGKLDAVLLRVDACREHLDRVPSIVKRFRQSVLSAATSGKLTQEWRDENGVTEQANGELPTGWRAKPLSEISQVIDPNPKHRNPRYVSKGLPFLSTTNFKDPDGWDLSSYSMVAETTVLEQEVRCKFRLGSLAFSRKGTIGKVRFLPHDVRFALLDSLCVINPGSEISSNYLKLAIESSFVQKQIAEQTRGVALRQVSVGVVRGLIIPVPSPFEQDEVVRRVETLFTYADRLLARYVTALGHVERLTPALLAKAFRGELVPQDPNDEPASVLLEEIRAARVAEPAEPKRRLKRIDRSSEFNKVEIYMINRKEIQAMHLAKILKERGPLTAEALWSASQLEIDDFYDQLKDEESRGLLKEKLGKTPVDPRLLEAVV